VRVLGDAAIVISRSIIRRAGGSDTRTTPTRSVTATWLLARTDGGRKITAYANTNR
jgi:hypothetical protein